MIRAMKRIILLTALVTVGALSLGLAAFQQPPAGAAAPKVVEVQKLRDNLFMLTGMGGGGNTAVFVRTDGITVVDTKNPGWGQPILDKIKELSSKPITTIINTHTHGDHTGSNQFFPASVEVIVQENTKGYMEKMPVFQEAANKNGLPDRTFKDKMSVLKGKDEIDLYYFGPAHTGGDAWVVFKNLRVMHAGDAFANKGFPLIDRANGGSGVGYPDTIQKAAKGIKNVDVIINGHSTTTMKWQDLVEWGEFNRYFLNYAQQSLKAGKSAEEAMKAFKVPDGKFQGYTVTPGGGRGGPAGNVGIIYEELKGSK